MADVIFVAVICAFFALCVLYVGWCDGIVGPDNFKSEHPADTDAASLAITHSNDTAEVTV